MSLERIDRIVLSERHFRLISANPRLNIRQQEYFREELKDGCKFVSINMELLKFSAILLFLSALWDPTISFDWSHRLCVSSYGT